MTSPRDKADNGVIPSTNAMNTRPIDLHTHSTASDGSFTPAELIRHATSKNLVTIALTDHDCTDGLDAALTKGQQAGIEVIPGLEISADFDQGTMHILGFFVNWKDENFQKQLKKLQEARALRNPEISRKLQELGLDITYEEVVAASGGGQVGRPHFAKVLVQKRHVTSMKEAFERYLKKDAPAYVEKFRFSPKKAIEMIHQAGGVAVLAHPFTLRLSSSQMEQDLLTELIQAGLDGIETYYSQNNPQDTIHYLKLCETYGLLPSGGSDFHGTHKPEVDLGVGRGDLCVPYDLLEPLREKARQHVRGSSSN